MKKHAYIQPKNGNFFTRNVLYIFIYAFLFAFAAFIIITLLYGLITSLRDPAAYNLAPVGGIDFTSPYFYQFKNYSMVVNNFEYTAIESFYSNGNLIIHDNGIVGIGGMLGNTLLYAGGGAIILAVMPALIAYLCAKYPYKWSKIMFFVYLAIMCIPIVGNFPSEITFLRNTMLYDQIWGNYLQKMGGAGMYFFVFYAFFKGLPDTYREAAEIDGASELKIMLKVYFPLAIKIIGTVFLIQVVALWNDFSTPYLYLKSHPTLSFGVYFIAFDPSGNPDLQTAPVKLASCMLLALPILLLFIIFKDKLMGNLSLGGIKE